ncbi:MAG TPA: hypothetical protein VMN60_09910 [Longimicrobiales bacterium]|nr:hypothetical protein [Longimicrobiales bacterium]
MHSRPAAAPAQTGGVPPSRGSAPRIALYSPGMIGLGHLRRNLLLARAFSCEMRDAAILMLTEAREAGSFDFPDNVDSLSLPAIRKNAAGEHSSRRLNVDLPTLVRMRSAILETAVAEFAPDVLIVDHLPLGALGELKPALERLSRTGRTDVVLGLRDILEAPANVISDWATPANTRAIEEHYSAVWVYGDPGMFDPFAEYRLPHTMKSIAAFTGYLDPFEHLCPSQAQNADTLATRLSGNERMILCQVGGGQDGIALAYAFAEADLPPDAVGVLVTGPFMPRADRERLARRAQRHGSRMTVLTLIAEPAELLVHAERVITMGGYNSMCELMSLGKHALVVPRRPPRQEQLIRATRLARRGLIHLLSPERLTPAALSAWMAAPADVGPTWALDMDGLRRATGYLKTILAGEWPHQEGQHGPPGNRRATA